MEIIKTEFPRNSFLNSREFHYVDSFRGEYLDEKNEISAKDIGKAFFTSAPNWVARLFDLRNSVVRVFGLKTPGKVSNRKELLDEFHCEKGEKLGLFTVFHRCSDEVVLGEDDKHLNFRVSLLKESGSVDQRRKYLTISTTVEFNNWFGKLYFFPVKPFHRFIVPRMLKGVIHQIETQKSTGR